ncbi:MULTISPECIES: hypothetical protein [unclassified Vibrio]|uniref:hypothetical protein n=1 Tax=unclassified Vibrio TaxID=2614977 RepID=UPI0013617A20|nr:MULTISPECIES: hypothetical protein [unclassified Vibrio]NAW56569.1 hypothetical protein [Vibrio sp. V36_P2S2PM302]NAX27678.1 hypothetical protein [Vibrio sp. V38_P2S17PM301]NAX29342.1 hypothetical protein [Vibrio sp. V37_P2S8PM304]
MSHEKVWSPSSHYVDFNESKELDWHLIQLGKETQQHNRATLRRIRKTLFVLLCSNLITHKQLHEHLTLHHTRIGGC